MHKMEYYAATKREKASRMRMWDNPPMQDEVTKVRVELYKENA